MKTIRHALLASLLALGATDLVQAGTLEFQDLGFTPSWTDHVLPLEVDPALTLEDSGSFDGDGGRTAGSLLAEDVPPAPVPEPSAYAIMLGGLMLLGGLVRGWRVAK